MLADSMFHKRGLAMRLVANALLPLSVGDKMPTVTELCAKADYSRGNIQSALDQIKAVGAAAYRPRGHLGSFLTEIDYFKLAGICGTDSLIGAMPLPYSRRYEGLATGIYHSLNTQSLTGHITFTRGSMNRLNLLERQHYDFVVMSALALEEYLRLGHKLSCEASFGACTYVERHVIVVGREFSGDWQDKLIALDDTSLDQRRLTQLYFSDKPVKFVHMKYNQILPSLLEGTIDGGVWNPDDSKLQSENIRMLELDDSLAKGRDTEAVIVCRTDDAVTHRLLALLLDTADICLMQEQVLSGVLIPQY